MKFQQDRFDAPSITAYGQGWLRVDQETVEHSLVISSQGGHQPWNCQRFEDLTPAHFVQLAEIDAEVVIFGSGQRLRFPPPAWLKPLIAKRIGLETMDTLAACRTYNILAGEGRRVAAALLLEP